MTNYKITYEQIEKLVDNLETEKINNKTYYLWYEIDLMHNMEGSYFGGWLWSTDLTKLELIASKYVYFSALTNICSSIELNLNKSIADNLTTYLNENKGYISSLRIYLELVELFKNLEANSDYQKYKSFTKKINYRFKKLGNYSKVLMFNRFSDVYNFMCQENKYDFIAYDSKEELLKENKLD